MAYVPGFQHDVFVSFSHLNDHEKWVTRFRQKLEARLRETIPPGADIFFDAQTLQGNTVLTAELNQALARTAVLVPIVSRSYLSSHWCELERAKFLSGGGGLDDRIFPVRYDDVSHTEYQKVLGERLGYEFFGRDEDDKYNDVFDPDCEEFKNRLNVLRIELGRKLEMMKTAAVQAEHSTATGNVVSAPTPGAVMGRPIVLLAETTWSAPRELAARRDNLMSYLDGYQITVVRPGDRFQEAENYLDDYSQRLGSAVLLVQLLGRNFTPHEDDQVRSWERWQFQQAQAGGLASLQWFYKYDRDQNEIKLDALDADHRAFVRQPGVWDNDFETFKQLVRDRAETLFQEKRRSQRADARTDNKPLIVLRSDKSDREFAESVGRALEQQQCEWTRVPDKDVQSLDEFAKQYAADGMLVIYRACPGKWVLSRLQELRKFLKTDIGRAWACGLWRDPADPEDALSCSVEGLMVIEPSNAAELQRFVAYIRGRERVLV